MAKFILDDFRQMTGVPQPGTTKALHHRLITGFVPHYTSLVDSADDANFKQKLLPPYPLVLAPTVATVNSYTGTYPGVMIANEGDSLAKVITSTDLWNFYVEDSSQTDLGIPNGTPATNVGIDAVVFAGKILTSHPLDSRLYHGAINATPAWTASTGVTLHQGIHILEVFQDSALVADADTNLAEKRYVQICGSGFQVDEGLDLGAGWNILDIRNHQDRYAVIFAEPSLSPRLLQHTTAFLWNGVAGSSWDFKSTLKGKYRCSIVKDGTLYAFTQLGARIICYRLNSTVFEEVGRIRGFSINSPLLIPKTKVGTDGEFFVLLVSSGDLVANAPLYWNPFTGDSFIIHKSIDGLTCKSMLTGIDLDAVPARYYSYQNGLGGGFLFKQTLSSSTKSIGGADYESNYIPMPIDPKIHHDYPMGRGKINNIVIEYSVKSPSTNDIIALTLTTKDEHTAETYNTFTASIEDTTANSTRAAIETKRAIINDIGVIATEFSVDLAVTVATNSWDLIIRRIIVDYTPIAHVS